MIDYELYCRIKDYHDHRQLTVAQIARELHLDQRTVARWLAAEKFQLRQVAARPSKLDPYKKQIVRWLESHPFSGEYIANLLEQRQRMLPEPGALHLTRRQDLLELELPEPNLALYETHQNPNRTTGETHESQQEPQGDAG